MPATVPDLPALLDAYYAGPTQGTLHALKGEASTRRYYRFVPFETARRAGPKSLIVMRLPDEDPDGASRLQARAFLDVQRFLAAQSLPVPAIYVEDVAHGLILLEDLGDSTFEARLQSTPQVEWAQSYGAAIDLLAQLHVACAPPRDPASCIAYGKHYDATLLRWELDHFREWGLEALHGPLSAADRSELDHQFDALTAAIVALPIGFVHRDYQSRNLLWAQGRLTIIDFQDAFLGPAPYDLVALLCDSYVTVSPELQQAMLARYADKRGYSAAAAAELVEGFRLISVQRKLKDAGRFVFIDRVRKNPDFLPFYPGSLAYVAGALGELPAWSGLRTLLMRLVPEYPR